MKRYRNSQEVCHAFCNRLDDGKASNLFFVGDTIYSYGTHFPAARIIAPSLAIVTTRKYSKTTAKHVSRIRGALARNGFRMIFVENPRGTFSENLDAAMAEVQTLLNAARKARTVDYVAPANRILADMHPYAQAVGSNVSLPQTVVAAAMARVMEHA